MATKASVSNPIENITETISYDEGINTNLDVDLDKIIIKRIGTYTEIEEDSNIDLSTELHLIQLKAEENYDKKRNSNEKETICEKEGVILSVTEDFVEIKFGSDTTVDFPRILFEDCNYLKYGQHLQYKILKNDEGFRYQYFEPIDDIEPHPDKDSILEELDKL